MYHYDLNVYLSNIRTESSTSLTKIVIIPIAESRCFNLTVNLMSPICFSVKVNGHTKRCRHMDKETDTRRYTHNTFVDFTGRYEVAHK